MRPPIIIDDTLFNDRVQRLIAAEGDSEKAGIPLEEIADLIHTRRMRINPMGQGSPSEPVTKGVKKPPVKGAAAIDDILG